MDSKGRLYTEYDQWKKKRRKYAKSKAEKELKTGEFPWYNPEGEFKTEECITAYLEMLQSGALTGDVMAVRFQAAQIQACKQAWLHRHCSIPRLLAHGYTENVVEANGLYDKYLTDLPSSYIQNAKQARQMKEG